MKPVWTILYNGIEKSADAWGISGLSRLLVSQEQDKVTFRANGKDFDSEPVFAFGDTIIIKKNGVPWFYGRVTSIPRTGNPDSELLDYELSGPWWYLDNLVFQQMWKIKNGTTGELVSTLKSRVILGQKLTDTSYVKMHMGEVIEEVLEWGILNGAPFQIGEIMPDMIVPYSEVCDCTCAEVIQTMLQWTPDTTVYFDYSITPPVLHMKRRASMNEVGVSLTDGQMTSEIHIVERTNLKVPAVVLKYEQINQIDSSTYTSVTVEKAPESATGLEFGAIVMTIELSGSVATTESHTITTRAIVENDVDWWTRKFPWLANMQNVSILEGSVSPNKPRELLTGSCPPWLDETTERVKVSAKISYKSPNGSEYEKDDITCNLRGTSLTDNTYTRTTSYTPSEPISPGLAQNFFDALQIPQFEGAFTLVEEECGSLVQIGTLLNLEGGRVEWATMRAQVQEIVEDVDQGKTTIKFGPSKFLSPENIVSLLRVNRGRIPTYRLDERSSGNSSSKGGQVSSGTSTSLENASKAGSGLKKQVITNTSSTLEQTSSDLKLYDASGNGAYLSSNGSLQLLNNGNQVWISPRDFPEAVSYVGFVSIDVCDNGVAKKMLVLASNPYGV